MRQPRAVKRHIKLFRALLEPAARSQGLSFEYQFLAPGTEPPEKALQLLMCGADLLLQVTEADTFPAVDGKVKAKGSRAAGRKIKNPGAQTALSFMTQGIPTILAQIWPDPEFQYSMRDLVQAYYPLPAAEREELEECEAEFRVMKTHEPREETRFGGELGTDYHLKLEAGDDPDQDPETVERQRLYAQDFFLLSAQRRALALIFGSEYSKLEPALERPGSMDFETVVNQRLRLLALRQVAEFWRNFTSPKPVPYADVTAAATPDY